MKRLFRILSLLICLCSFGFSDYIYPYFHVLKSTHLNRYNEPLYTEVFWPVFLLTKQTPSDFVILSYLGEKDGVHYYKPAGVGLNIYSVYFSTKEAPTTDHFVFAYYGESGKSIDLSNIDKDAGFIFEKDLSAYYGYYTAVSGSVHEDYLGEVNEPYGYYLYENPTPPKVFDFISGSFQDHSYEKHYDFGKGNVVSGFQGHIYFSKLVGSSHVKSCGYDEVFDEQNFKCVPFRCKEGDYFDAYDSLCKPCVQVVESNTRFKCMCEKAGYGKFVKQKIISSIQSCNGCTYKPSEFTGSSIQCENGSIDTDDIRNELGKSDNTESWIDFTFGSDSTYEELSGNGANGNTYGGANSESEIINNSNKTDVCKNLKGSVSSAILRYRNIYVESGVDCSNPSATSGLNSLKEDMAKLIDSATEYSCLTELSNLKYVYGLSVKCNDTGEVYKDPNEQGGGSSTDPGGTTGGGGTTVTEPGDNPGGQSQEGGSSSGSEDGGEGGEGSQGGGEGDKDGDEEGEEEGDGTGEDESAEIGELFSKGLESAYDLKGVYEKATNAVDQIKKDGIFSFNKSRVESCPYPFNLNYGYGVVDASFDFCSAFSHAYGLFYFLTFVLTLWMGFRWILARVLHLGSSND